LEDIVGKKEKGDNTRDWYLPLLNRKVSLASRPANLEDSPISAYVAGGAFNRPIRRGLSVGGSSQTGHPSFFSFSSRIAPMINDTGGVKSLRQDS
jgi:hypothetical protein